eukprot:345855-Pleurochrysis_carterae.AAC.3
MSSRLSDGGDRSLAECARLRESVRSPPHAPPCAHAAPRSSDVRRAVQPLPAVPFTPLDCSQQSAAASNAARRLPHTAAPAAVAPAAVAPAAGRHSAPPRASISASASSRADLRTRSVHACRRISISAHF